MSGTENPPCETCIALFRIKDTSVRKPSPAMTCTNVKESYGCGADTTTSSYSCTCGAAWVQYQDHEFGFKGTYLHPAVPDKDFYLTLPGFEQERREHEEQAARDAADPAPGL